MGDTGTLSRPRPLARPGPFHGHGAGGGVGREGGRVPPRRGWTAGPVGEWLAVVRPW